MDRRLCATLIAAVLLSCAPGPNAPASPTYPTIASARPSTSANPATSTQVLLAGKMTSAVTEREQYAGFADIGSLYAVSTRDAPSPYLSKIQRFDPSARIWQTVFEDDARFSITKANTGRLAILEYREPFQGRGASDQKVVILDLSSGRSVNVDGYSLSAETFHGGGGGPRRAGSGLALGSETVAWTRVNELAGGDLEGELRMASLGDTTRFTTVGRSRAWIEPLWIDGGALFYLVGGTTVDEIRARDVGSGTERRVASLRAPGQSAGRAGIARSGSILGWIDNPPLAGAPDAKPGDPTSSFLHTVDLTSGATRDLDLGTDYCYGLSGNAVGFTWACKTSSAPRESLSYFDPRGWRSIVLVRSTDRPNQLEAWENAFTWYDVINGSGRVNLLVLP